MQWDLSTKSRRAGASYPPAVHNRLGSPGMSAAAERLQPAARPVDGIEGVDLAVVAGQDEAAADQLGRGHHVRVGDPPGDRPVRLDRERLELGLDEDVRQPRRAEQREDRGRRTMFPGGAHRCRSRVRTCGTRSSPRAGRRVSQTIARGSSEIVEANRAVHDAARALDAQFGATERLGSAGDVRSRGRCTRAADLGRARRRRPLAAAAPPPASAQAARVGDRRVARFAAHAPGGPRSADRLAGPGGPAPALRAAPRRSGRRSRSRASGVSPGGTGKTAVGSPAAAQTTG